MMNKIVLYDYLRVNGGAEDLYAITLRITMIINY